MTSTLTFPIPGWAFEKRIIAFVDVLGWTDLVQQAEGDADLRRRLTSAALTLENHHRAADIQRGLQLARTTTWQCSWFSDSLLISVEETTPALIHLLYQLQSLAHGLLYQARVLVRGAVIVGNIHHSGNRALGTGLIAAYKWQEACIDPRIVVAEDLAAVIETAAQQVPAFQHMISRDSDGLMFVDVFGLHRSMSPSNGTGATDITHVMLERAQKIIGEELMKLQHQPRPHSHWQWMDRYAARKLGELQAADTAAP